MTFCQWLPWRRWHSRPALATSAGPISPVIMAASTQKPELILEWALTNPHENCSVDIKKWISKSNIYTVHYNICMYINIYIHDALWVLPVCVCTWLNWRFFFLMFFFSPGFLEIGWKGFLLLSVAQICREIEFVFPAETKCSFSDQRHPWASLGGKNVRCERLYSKHVAGHYSKSS